jgi:NAD(P)-dependent dehydrogenase (short-subunit alcohol dehydrogenase family)
VTTAVALVTGGARMGGAVGLALADRGLDVAFSFHRSRQPAEDAAAGVVRAGRQASTFHADLRRPSHCAALVHEVLAWRGRLDVLVCLASVFERVPLADLTADVWRSHLSVDLDASFHCAQAAAVPMRAQGGGLIVLSADWVAASSRPRYTGYLPYFVAKAGVVALTQALALELAADGIRVNAVAPGPILPAAGASLAEQAATLNATPLGRWGEPEAVAHAVGGLVDATFVTGEVVRVDGGRHLR